MPLARRPSPGPPAGRENELNSSQIYLLFQQASGFAVFEGATVLSVISAIRLMQDQHAHPALCLQPELYKLAAAQSRRVADGNIETQEFSG